MISLTQSKEEDRDEGRREEGRRKRDKEGEMQLAHVQRGPGGLTAHIKTVN